MAESENGSTYDVIVLGAGPVGENAADRAGRHGLRVAIIERRLVGGECSFWACIPSKALLRPIHAAHAAQRVRGVTGATLHPDDVFARRDHFVSHYDDGGATSWLESAGIDLIRGSGRLTGPRTVEVDGTTYEAQVAVVLATGSAPAIPDIPGLRDAQPWTNVEATAATTVPQRLVVLGGGVVACEMAQVFAALGSSVTVIERGDRLLGRAEPVASALVRDGLKRAGATVRLGVTAVSVSRPAPGGRVSVSLSDGSSVTADEILCALGRTPRTDELGLDSVGAKVDARGFVEVDDTGEVTSVPGQWLYAVGDVNGRNLLTHMGKYQGRVAGDVIAARAAGHPTDGPGMAAWADHLGAPQVVFTDPEVASAGLTEAAARSEGRLVRVVDVDLATVSGAGLQADDFTGAARMVVDAETRVVLGATFVGQDVAEMAHAAAVAVTGRLTVDALWHAIPSFPTMSEAWLRLLEEYGL